MKKNYDRAKNLRAGEALVMFTLSDSSRIRPPSWPKYDTLATLEKDVEKLHFPTIDTIV